MLPSVPVDWCFVVFMMESACAHAENNIARLTKPFLRACHTQTHALPCSGGHVFCTVCHYGSLDVVTGWHWGFLELLFYDNFHSFSLLSLAIFHVYPDPASTTPSLFSPNPHPFLLLLQWDACLFLVHKPSWQNSFSKTERQQRYIVRLKPDIWWPQTGLNNIKWMKASDST